MENTIHSPLRFGIVTAQDLAGGRVRVQFSDFDQVISYWLSIAYPKTQSDKAYWIPDIGEQVACLMDDRDETGVVIGAIYSNVDATPAVSADRWRLAFKDGAAFEYDRAAHALIVSLPAGATLNVTANGSSIAVDASANVTVHAAGGINLITASHNDSVDGIINTYNTHTHPDPQGGNTGTPTQQMT